MRMKFYFLVILSLASFLSAFCQSSDYEFFIVGNGNLYLPINSPDKGVYPILGYDENSNPKFLVGGLGVGFSVFKPVKEKVSLKGQANFSRNAYWDTPYFLTEDGINGIFISPHTYDYTFGLTGTAHYFLSEKFCVGTGLGARILLYSVSKLNDINTTIVNQQYKPVMPVIPLEVSLKLKRTLLNIRYEYGLLNRLKGDLSQYKTDKYGLLIFEMGWQIR